MRITNTMLINNMIGYVGKNMERMDKYQSQLATGKKISRPSDDPIVASKSLKLRTDVAMIGQYQKNLKDAQSWIETTEAAISDVNTIFQRARELAVQGSNGTLTQDDRQKVSQELSQLKDQMILISNSTYAGRYIFSGYKTDSKLLNTDGTFNIMVGKNEKIQYEIGMSDSIAINVPGSMLFNEGKDVSSIPAKSSLIQDFEEFIDALGTNATYTASDSTPVKNTFPFDATDYNDLVVTIDGVAHNIDLTDSSAGVVDTTAMTQEQLLAEINADIGSAGTASVNSQGMLEIKSSSIGAASGVAVTGTDKHVRALFGTNPRTVPGTSLSEGVFMGSKDVNEPIFAYQPAPLDATGYDDLTITLDGILPISVNLSDGTAFPPAADATQMSLEEIVAEINADIAAGGGGGTASIQNGRIVLASDTTGAGSSVEVTAGNIEHVEKLFGANYTSVLGTASEGGALTGDIYNAMVLNIKINGVNHQVNLSDSSSGLPEADPEALTLGQVVNEINAELKGLGRASLVDGKLRITSNDGGDGSAVEITSADEGLLNALFGSSPEIMTASVYPTKGTYTGGVDVNSLAYPIAAASSIDITVDLETTPVNVDISDAAGLPEVVDRINASLGDKGNASIITESGKTYVRSSSKWKDVETGDLTDTITEKAYLQVSSATKGHGSKIGIASSTPGMMKSLFGSGTSHPPAILPGADGYNVDISEAITMVDKHLANLQVVRAELGAKINRIELTSNRLDSDNLNFTKLMSENENVDMAEVIMQLQNEENVYRASLSGGARIIQPSLVDFLK